MFVHSSPVMDGPLAGVSPETGISSPNDIRNMLGQFTQNPVMMNTNNKFAKQIKG